MIPADTPSPAVPPAPTFATISPVFVSHGSPLLMLAPGAVGRAWEALFASAPRPRAILAVSAHWMTRSPAVSAAPEPETIHDFYGFPDALYDIRYEPPGAVDLAREVQALVPGIAVDPRRGLDHGAWVPLRSMAPAADIPVAQFAILPGRSAEEHYRLGQRLQPLAATGVLVLASGGATHNLRDLVRDAPAGAALPYVAGFRDWLASALERGDTDALLAWREQAPHALRAHPSDDHLLPLFVALGAAGAGAKAETAYRGYDSAALAMDAWRFTPAAAAPPGRAAPASRG